MKYISKRGKISIGKWHFKLGIIPLYYNFTGYVFHFGIFKMISRPPEGAVIDKRNYKGFWLRKEFNFNGFEISL